MQETNIIKVSGSDIDATARRRNELVTAKFSRLSYQAHRLFLYVLAQVRDEHNEDTEYEFSVSELAAAIDIDRSNLYKTMVGALDELARTMVEMPVIDAEGKPMKDRIVRVGLIKNKQELRLLDNGEKKVHGSVSVTIYKELLPYVHKLKVGGRYTEVSLKYVFRLSSGYSQKLYDLLKSEEFKNRAWRVSRGELFELLDVDEGKYRNWGDFRRFALERAQKEINAHTDIAFDIEYVMVGRSVNEVVFHYRREGGHQVNVTPGTDKHRAFNAMLDIGISAHEAERVIGQWWDVDPDRILHHAIEAKKKAATGKLRNAVGWFRSGMKKDFRPPRLLFAEMQKRATRSRDKYIRETTEGPMDKRVETALQEVRRNFGRHNDVASSA